MLFRVATLFARAWPFVGLPAPAAVEVVAVTPARLEDGRPPEVVGLAVVGVDGPEPAAVLPAAVAVDDETRLRLLVEAFAGYRVRVRPGSLVEDVLVRPESALVLLKGALVGPELVDPPPPPAPAATSLCLVDVDVVAEAGWRVEELLLSNDDKGFGLFFLGASEAVVAVTVLFTMLAPETVRVVGRVAARDLGAGSLLGETGRCDAGADADGPPPPPPPPPAVELAGPLAAVIEAEEDTEIVVVVGGRSVEEPCVGFRRERVRASDEDMTTPGSLGCVW